MLFQVRCLYLLGCLKNHFKGRLGDFTRDPVKMLIGIKVRTLLNVLGSFELRFNITEYLIQDLSS